MTLSNAQILSTLVRPEVFPAEAIRLADERREEIAPLLIAEIEAWGSGRHTPVEPDYYLADIACHLLAEWRDTRAFKPFLALLASEDSELLGDSVTESVPTLVPRLYDGDEMALRALVFDQQVDEFARNAVLEGYVQLVEEGQVAREQAHSFLTDMFATLPHAQNYVWSGFAHAVANLQFEDMAPLVRQIFDEDAIDITWEEYSDFEEDFEAARSGSRNIQRRALVGPAEALRSWRYMMQVREERARYGDKDEDEELLDFLGEDAGAALNPYRHVGRNDPCPCGSGKKFKKCCLEKFEAGEL